MLHEFIILYCNILHACTELIKFKNIQLFCLQPIHEYHKTSNESVDDHLTIENKLLHESYQQLVSFYQTTMLSIYFPDQYPMKIFSNISYSSHTNLI